MRIAWRANSISCHSLVSQYKQISFKINVSSKRKEKKRSVYVSKLHGWRNNIHFFITTDYKNRYRVKSWVTYLGKERKQAQTETQQMALQFPEKEIIQADGISKQKDTEKTIVTKEGKI